RSLSDDRAAPGPRRLGFSALPRPRRRAAPGVGRGVAHSQGSSHCSHRHLFLEFDVPRLGSRIDAVLISGPAVFPIEFKCGESHHRLADYNQAWDYALDLKNFHAGSHDASIFPVLVATQAQAADDAWQLAYADGVRPPYRCNARYLRRA